MDLIALTEFPCFRAFIHAFLAVIHSHHLLVCFQAMSALNITVKEEPPSSEDEAAPDEYAGFSNLDDSDIPSTKPKTDVLQFENNLMVDTMHDDVLIISGRGLGYERLFALHLQLYSDRKMLVLVINTNQNDEHYFLKKLSEVNANCQPKILNSDVSTKDREDIYLQGGVVFVTSRILMVDLLTERIPVESVSGIMVYRAHTLMTSFQESFILRLLREKKPGVFVKAFSDCPAAIVAGGIGQLQRLVDKLYVRRVRVLPRFDVDVKTDFDRELSYQQLVEIRVDLPTPYRKVVSPLVDIIRTCVRELKQASPGVTSSMAEESASPYSGVIPSALEIELKQKSLMLTEKQQRLLKDLSQLRGIMEQVEHLDPISAFRAFKAIRNNKDLLATNSGWVFTRTAAKIHTALEDVSHNMSKSSLYPAKWGALASILDEIRRIAERRFAEGSAKEKPSNILILCASGEACKLLADVLKFGIESYGSELEKQLADEEERDCEIKDSTPLWEPHRVATFGLDYQQHKKNREGLMSDLVKDQKKEAKEGRKRRAKAETVASKGRQTSLSDFGVVSKKQKAGNAEPKAAEPSTSKKGNSLDISDPTEGIYEDPQILLIPHGERYNLQNQLQSLKPEFVLFYNMDLVSLRIVETFRAVEDCPSTVYTFMYKESTEEDRYYHALRREQLAFEQILREQMVLLIPREWNVDREQPPIIQKSTRDGRAIEQPENPSVIVDMREFNSELPTVLYKKGIDLVPSTVEVGDYILSDDIAVERKALDDLTQSLHSGRVFKQVQQMLSNYKHAVLLIESRDKFRMKMVNGGPFQGELSRRCRETRSLFTILVRSNPKLHCLWSMDPRNTAELFEELKMNQANPNLEKALAIKWDNEGNPDEEPSSSSTSQEDGKKAKKVNPVLHRQLLHLPGLTGGDVDKIMRSNIVKNVFEVATATEEKLIKAVGQNEPQAKALHSFLTMDFRYS
ncbi:hypothetical protein L596_017691 [Steinernema carpocapsae]|uniref:DNA repair endonuclease XPF n=1 Tax=Steinernema carpocapsae TaxID=34508 RepID=A0A4U5N374_STECR|nr:hypothetical protein L596_017691 [Steinernema carpocapsae]